MCRQGQQKVKPSGLSHWSRRKSTLVTQDCLAKCLMQVRLSVKIHNNNVYTIWRKEEREGKKWKMLDSFQNMEIGSENSRQAYVLEATEDVLEATEDVLAVGVVLKATAEVLEAAEDVYVLSVAITAEAEVELLVRKLVGCVVVVVESTLEESLAVDGTVVVMEDVCVEDRVNGQTVVETAVIAVTT